MTRMRHTIILFFLCLVVHACGTDSGIEIPAVDTIAAIDSTQFLVDQGSHDAQSSPELCHEAKTRMAADPCLICLCTPEGDAICEGVALGVPCAIEDCCYQEAQCLQCGAGDDSCLDSGLVCTGTPDVECINENECTQYFPVCTEGTCSCAETSVEPGAPCTADSNACTVGDFCAEGSCVQGPQLDLDDGNPCTIGVCVKGQVVQQMLEGQCTDGNPCTIEEECKMGQCVAEKLRTCELIPCAQTAYCDFSTGECAFELKLDGSPCLLADSPCGSEGRCEQGECVPLGNQLEICDGLDNDCDGLTDEDQPVLQCGDGICFSQTPSCLDGVTQVCVAVEGTPETCDGLDNDCDGLIDEDQGELSCGVGPCINTVEACINGVEQWCLPQFNCCPNGMLDEGEECDDGDMVDEDWCNNQCQETGQNCDSSDPINTTFVGIDDTTVGVATWCNFACFAYWSPLLDDIAWAWVCNGEIFVCPIGLTDCEGSCPHPECVPAD